MNAVTDGASAKSNALTRRPLLPFDDLVGDWCCCDEEWQYVLRGEASVRYHPPDRANARDDHSLARNPNDAAAETLIPRLQSRMFLPHGHRPIKRDRKSVV